MAELSVELVAVDRQLWSGQAEAVYARTLEGELGVLAGHVPLLGVLAEGHIVRIVQPGGEQLLAAVHGGFLSVTAEGVQILAESAELGDEIDASAARSELEHAGSGDDEQVAAARLRAQGRLRAAGEQV